MYETLVPPHNSSQTKIVLNYISSFKEKK